jgi:hypothetical protein
MSHTGAYVGFHLELVSVHGQSASAVVAVLLSVSGSSDQSFVSETEPGSMST